MIAAFFIVVAYIGFADAGSRLMAPPPPPERALAAPEERAVSVTSRDVVLVESSARPERPAGR